MNDLAITRRNLRAHLVTVLDAMTALESNSGKADLRREACASLRVLSKFGSMVRTPSGDTLVWWVTMQLSDLVEAYSASDRKKRIAMIRMIVLAVQLRLEKLEALIVELDHAQDDAHFRTI
jgi:hypothetical protein